MASDVSRQPAPELRLIDLDRLHQPLEQAEAALGLLSQDERSWSAPLANEVRRRRRTARIALRLLLYRREVDAARGVPLAVDANGKPRLPAGGPAFSVSHSGGLALIAIGPRGPLGIDLEAERIVQLGPERRQQITAAGLALSAIPSRRGGEPYEQDCATFLQAWTCLEAFAKADGGGVAVLLTRLAITAAGRRRTSVEEVRLKAEALRAQSGLQVVALTLAPPLFGALALPAGSTADAPTVRTLAAADCGIEPG